MVKQESYEVQQGEAQSPACWEEQPHEPVYTVSWSSEKQLGRQGFGDLGGH